MKKNNNQILNESLIGRAAEEWQEVLWDNLLAELPKVKSKKELKEILESLLAEGEKRMILRRLAAAVLIKQEKSYKEIGRILWVSPATISAIKKNLLSKNIYHQSHRSVYKNKKYRNNFVNVSKKSFSERVADFIAKLAEKAAREFSNTAPVTLTSYARSMRRTRNKN